MLGPPEAIGKDIITSLPTIPQCHSLRSLPLFARHHQHLAAVTMAFLVSVGPCGEGNALHCALLFLGAAIPALVAKVILPATSLIKIKDLQDCFREFVLGFFAFVVVVCFF